MELYEIPGMLGYKTEKISLDEFFENGKDKRGDEEPAHFVTVRPFPPFTAAEIETLSTGGITIHQNKTTTVKTDADTKMRVRELALAGGVEDHNICDATGKKLPWDKPLWKSLDRNPAILRKVLKGIWKINPAAGEEEEKENPT